MSISDGFFVHIVIIFFIFRVVNSLWGESLVEYFNVDSSSHMNDLSQVLLQGGRGNKSPEFRGVFYRQFLPATNVS